MQIIPFSSRLSVDRFSTVLDDVPCVFRTRWNARDEAWYFDLYEEDGVTAIVYGIKIVLGTNLGHHHRHRHSLFRDGAMIAHDLSGSLRDATRRDLGSRIVVLYYTQTDLAARASTL